MLSDFIIHTVRAGVFKGPEERNAVWIRNGPVSRCSAVASLIVTPNPNPGNVSLLLAIAALSACLN